MKIAVDIDGTLTSEPENIRELMKQLLHDRNKVIVLTGCLNDQPSEEERIKQLEELGLKKKVHYSELIRIGGFTHDQVSYGKASYCRDQQVDMIFENDDKYIADINILAPKTTCFLIRRWSQPENEVMVGWMPKKEKK